LIRFRRTLVSVLLASGAVSLALTRLCSGQAPAGEASEPLRLGRVEFPTSGRPAAQPYFVRGVAALHSFWYEEAIEAFQSALRLDPDFAMAGWGVAMTYKRPFVPGSDDEAGRRALAGIRETTSITARERGYIDALRAWYAEGTPADRARAYAVAMRKVHRAYPDDLEAAAFYSLSLLGHGWPDEDVISRHTAAAEIAGEVYRRNPNHPGAAHYLIHSYDEPELAERGLDAARHYAAIAPDAPHALHMPSHIFLQLGMWSETTRSNEVAWAASEGWVQRKQLSRTLRDYHNYHWLIYSCLQQGRYAKAAELVNEFRAMRKDILPEQMFFFQKAAAAYVVETRSWDRAEALFGPAGIDTVSATPRVRGPQAIEICGADRDQPAALPGVQPADIPAFIRTLAAAARGASDTEQRLKELRASAGGDQAMPEFWRIRVLEIMAVRHARENNFDAAITAMREATAIEEELGKPPGPPAAYKPPHELFGEILLQAGKPAEAAALFNKNLLLHPNRALSMLGRARAEAAQGEKLAARATYTRFLEIWQHADDNLPEIREAREFVTTHG
jgi:tetratricopeptide (TPR) repeat protein